MAITFESHGWASQRAAASDRYMASRSMLVARDLVEYGAFTCEHEDHRNVEDLVANLAADIRWAKHAHAEFVLWGEGAEA